MSNIRALLQRRLQQKKLDKVVVGTLVIKHINKLMGRDDIGGHVKNTIIFLETYDQALRIRLFQKQVELLAQINDYLDQQGFRATMTKIMLR